MKAVLASLVIALMAVVCVSPAWASEEWAFEAFQPIWTANEIKLSRVTVMTYNSGDVGVSAVLSTCDSNQVMTDYGPQQRNAAFDAGLRAEVSFNPGMEPPLFGDTLRVILRGKPQEGVEDFSFVTILTATIQCILANAAQSTAIKFVAIQVESYRGYGGVFRTSGFRKGPTKKVFN